MSGNYKMNFKNHYGYKKIYNLFKKYYTLSILNILHAENNTHAEQKTNR